MSLGAALCLLAFGYPLDLYEPLLAVLCSAPRGSFRNCECIKARVLRTAEYSPLTFNPTLPDIHIPMQLSNSTVWQSGPDVDSLDQRLLDDLKFSQEFAEVMQYVVTKTLRWSSLGLLN